MIKNLNAVAFLFVWDELLDYFDSRRLDMKAMFGCHSVYLDSKIIFILRKKDDDKTSRDNGIWVALSGEEAMSLKEKFSSLRPLEMFQPKTPKKDSKLAFSNWLNLPESEVDFEESAMELCQLVIRADPRIGRLPKAKLHSKKPKPPTIFRRKLKANEKRIPLSIVKNFGPVCLSEFKEMKVIYLDQIKALGAKSFCTKWIGKFPSRLNSNAFLGVICALDGIVWTNASARHRNQASKLVKELKAKIGSKKI